MKAIAPALSHINLILKSKKPKSNEWAMPRPLDEVIKSKPKTVHTYDELVMDIAQIQYYNRNLVLFYRGQAKEYLTDSRTIILPSIYRKGKNESRLLLIDRFRILLNKTEELKERFRNSKIKYTGRALINKYPEISWSILQHYEVCPTPLLDMTHSLHVACSFAYDKNKGKTGIIYVLGMPWQTDAVGYNSYEEIVNLRLLSVCPPSARRPFFQEGYLAGPFPNYQLDNTNRIEQFDFARRLVAKFEIPINNESFWGDGFAKIPHEKLYQTKDSIKEICQGL